MNRSRRVMFQMPVEEVVRHLAHVFRKVVLAVGVVRLQVSSAAVQLVDRLRGGDQS